MRRSKCACSVDAVWQRFGQGHKFRWLDQRREVDGGGLTVRCPLSGPKVVRSVLSQREGSIDIYRANADAVRSESGHPL